MSLFFLIALSSYAQPAPGGDPDVPKVELCPGGSTSITSNITGTTYQWQVDTGKGFVNITDNVNYSGTNSKTLQLNNVPSSWYGYQFRSVVDGNYSLTIPIIFVTTWTGSKSTAWENPLNWSCSLVPDANTDVLVSSGTVILNSNAACRSLKVDTGAAFTVSPGYTLSVMK